MASSEIKKAKNNSLIETDRLSNLPEDVKENILTYLPIEEAGRTSILSTKWRYSWESIPVLLLDDPGDVPTFVEFVDTILVLHSGPIRKFSIYTYENSHKALGRWIVNLSKNGIRDLTICLSREGGDFYILNSRFFSCGELNCVDLCGCFIKVPFWFKGFKLLHTLELVRANVSDNDIEILISSCPLLEKLGLLECWDFIVLKIHAPNLLSLVIDTEFSNLQICAPKLRYLYVELSNLEESCEHSESVLCNLADIENFQLKDHFLAYLCAEPLREEFPLAFNHLKNLDISLDFEQQKEAAFVLALFERAPYLQSLNIEVYLSSLSTLPIAEFWEKVDRGECMFKQLQTVNICQFIADDAILSFVKFILCSAPQLVTLTIEEYPLHEEKDLMFRQLLQMERASPKAKIVVK